MRGKWGPSFIFGDVNEVKGGPGYNFLCKTESRSGPITIFFSKIVGNRGNLE